jgi:hypothetical protein
MVLFGQPAQQPDASLKKTSAVAAILRGRRAGNQQSSCCKSDHYTTSFKLYCTNLAWSLPAVLLFSSTTACSALTGRGGQQHGAN